MKSFTDNLKRIWVVDINVETVKRVRTLLAVNLLDIFNNGGELLSRLGNDYELLINVLYATCKPECDAKNISDVDFGIALGGDSIDDACTALTEALIEFFPQKKRELLTKALSKSNEITSKIIQLQMDKLDNPETEAAILKSLGITSTNSAGSSQV
jgi:hypothetical protein